MAFSNKEQTENVQNTVRRMTFSRRFFEFVMEFSGRYDWQLGPENPEQFNCDQSLKFSAVYIFFV